MEALSPASMAVAMVMALMIGEEKKRREKEEERKGKEGGSVGDDLW